MERQTGGLVTKRRELVCPVVNILPLFKLRLAKSVIFLPLYLRSPRCQLQRPNLGALPANPSDKDLEFADSIQMHLSEWLIFKNSPLFLVLG